MSTNKTFNKVQLDVKFTQAATRANLISEENISISFGKISKYFADLHSQAFTGYTHPTYTARTGKPTGNQTPGFGSTFTISQITSDGTGHVTAATDRTVKIPDTTMGAASADAAGSKGLVPAPAAGKQTSFLRGDGTWATPTNTNTTYTIGTSGNNVTLTPSSGSVQSITVPYATTASKLGSSTVGSTRKPIYLNSGTATEANYMVSHFGNAGTSNMNDIGRLHASVGMTDLSDPGNNYDNPMNGTTKSTSWHLYWDASYKDDPNGSNSWVAQIANKAGTAQWWVRSRKGGTITNGTKWAAGWEHLTITAQAGAGSATNPVYVDSNGHTQACTYSLNKSVPSNAEFTDANVLQSATTTTDYRPIVTGAKNTTTIADLDDEITSTVYTSENFFVQPSTGSLYATQFFTKSYLSGTGVNVTSNGIYARSYFKRADNTVADYKEYLIRTYNGKITSNDGILVSVGGGGLTIVGGGESSSALAGLISDDQTKSDKTTLNVGGTLNTAITGNSEQLIMSSDDNIYFLTNCQTIANRKPVCLDASSYFYPGTTNTGSIGTSSYKWASMYATTFYGALSGNASSSNYNVMRGITIKTGSSNQSHITLQTLMVWLITTKGYINSNTAQSLSIYTSWSYAENDILQLAIAGTNYELQLAGVIIEFDGYASDYQTGTFRLRIHSSPTISFTATSGYTQFPTSHIAEYTCNGSGYSPTWKMLIDLGDTIAIAHGGTGATTRLNALKNLTNENVGTNATYFLTITDSWGKGGYTSVANVKTVLGLKSAAYTESTAYLSSSTKYAGSSSAGGAANSANVLNYNNSVTATTSGLQYTHDQITIGAADGNAAEGSNASYKLWSYPTGGTVTSSTYANIQNLRLYWSSAYFRDIFLSPNNDMIYHRAVINNSAKPWYVLLDSNNLETYSLHTPDTAKALSTGTGQDMSPITRPQNLHNRSNKLALIPGSNITVEYSTNAGSNWTDMGLTADMKGNLFNDTISATIPIGPNNSTDRTTSMQTRITITCDGRDQMIDQYILWLDSSYQTISIDLQVAYGNATTTFTNIRTGLSCKPWIYQYILNTETKRFGTSTTSAYVNKIRFVIKYTAINGSYKTSKAIIHSIAGYSGIYWGGAAKNNLMIYDHLYTWDNSQNATFPAQLNATGATFTSSSYGALSIKRTSTNNAGIKFYNNGSTYLGSLAIDTVNGTFHRFKTDDSTMYEIIDRSVVRNNTTAGTLGWTSSSADTVIPTVNTIAYWNGAYSGTSSNLAYCKKGEFGTIVTKSTTDYSKVTSSTTNGKIKIDGTDTTVYTHPSHTSKTSGLYKITVDTLGHVSSTASVAKGDIPALDYLPLAGGSLSGSMNFKSTTYDGSAANNGVSSGISYPTTFNILDKSSRILVRLEGVINSSGSIGSYWYVRNYNTSGTQVDQKGISMTMAKDGTLTYTVSDGAKFRSAIGAGTSSLTIGTTSTTAAAGDHTHELLHSDLTQVASKGTTGGWSVIGIDPAVNGYVLKSIRINETSPNWLSGGYGAGIAFGGYDTKGVISMRWDSPVITFAGGNHKSTITSPKWYFKISGTSGSTYDLANFDAATATTASKLSNTSAIGSSTQPVYFNENGVPVACTQDDNKAHFSTVPFVRNDGVMEVGRYFDMHSTNTGTTDYDVRLDASGVSSFRFTFNTPKSSSIAPSTNNQTSLGTSSLKWSNVYATTFYGALSGNASTATRADYVNVVASNEIRFYNDNQFKANNHFWLGYSWADGSHYTPSGGSDTSSTTAPNITEFVMGNCTAGGLASVHAKTFILGNGSSPTKSSKTTTIATAATTTDRTITLPNASGNVILGTKGSTSFWGLMDGAGSISEWIRATSSGFIPSQGAKFFQTATSSLGTNTWYFKNSYIQYMNANRLILGAAKTADGAAKGQVKFFSGNGSDATGTVTLECIDDAVHTGDYTVKLPTWNGTIPIFEKLFEGASNTVSLSYSDINEYDVFLITVANSNATSEQVTVTSLWISNVAGIHDMPLIWGGAPTSSGGACNVTSGWIQLSKNSGKTTFVVAHKPNVAQMTSSGWTISSPTYNLYIRKIFGLKAYKRT